MSSECCIYDFSECNAIVPGLAWAVARFNVPLDLTGLHVRMIIRVRFTDNPVATYTDINGKLVIGTFSAGNTPISPILTAVDTALLTVAGLYDYILEIYNTAGTVGRRIFHGTIEIKD